MFKDREQEACAPSIASYEEPVIVGSLVRTGTNFHPHFEVVAISGVTAWVRNVDTKVDGFAPLENCHVLTPKQLH